jgi:hypothetical protein
MQSRDAKTAIETKVVNENQTSIETKVVNETRYEYWVSKRIGVSKRIVNRMGSEDLFSRETDRTVPANRSLKEMEGSKTKNITGKDRRKSMSKDTPRNKLPVLKAWLMFKEQDPANYSNNQLKARRWLVVVRA